METVTWMLDVGSKVEHILCSQFIRQNVLAISSLETSHPEEALPCKMNDSRIPYF